VLLQSLDKVFGLPANFDLICSLVALYFLVETVTPLRQVECGFTAVVRSANSDFAFVKMGADLCILAQLGEASLLEVQRIDTCC
jgi:hypothetical protein